MLDVSRLAWRGGVYTARARWGALLMVQWWRARLPLIRRQGHPVRYRDLW